MLGASVLLNLAPAVFSAEEPVAAERPSILDGTTPRPAAERWKRLKAQYEFTPAPVTRSQIKSEGRRPEAGGDRRKPGDAGAGSTTVRTIPAGTVSNIRTIPAASNANQADANQTLTNQAGAAPADANEETVVPVRNGAFPAESPDKVPAARPLPAAPSFPADPPVKAAPFTPIEEPEWALPVPASPDPLESDGRTVEEFFGRPKVDEPPAAGIDAALPDTAFRDEERLPYEEKTDGTLPAEAAPVEAVPGNPGTRRPLPLNPTGPPLKTTQVRRMRDITPLNDFDKDSEIKRYAAEKAREFNVQFGGEEYTPRNFPEVAAAWDEPRTNYYPLYFQDPALERYGHTHHFMVQPVVSSARFSAQLVMLPHQMAIKPPWELQSPLGWYRPGDVVPKLRYPFPWNAKAAAVEAASVTGLIFIIP